MSYQQTVMRMACGLQAELCACELKQPSTTTNGLIHTARVSLHP